MDTFEIVGTLRKIDSDSLKGFESRKSESGYSTKTCRFNVVSGNNSIMVQTKGTVKLNAKGDKVDPSQKIYTRSREKENIEIDWADRNKADIVANVAAWKKFVIDAEKDRKKLDKIRKNISDGNALADEDYKFLGVQNLDEASEVIKSRTKKEYLHEWDYASALNKFLDEASGKYKVSGNISISYDFQNKVAYKNYSVTKIEKVSDDAECYAHAIIDFFYNKDVLDLDNWVEKAVEGKKAPEVSGKAVANGKQMFFIKDKRYDVNGTFATDVSFEISGITKNYGIKSRLSKEFADDVTWKEIRLTLNIIDGSEEIELTEDMLTEDQLIDIECGATTLEEIKKDMNGKIYGDRVRKYTFSKLTDNSKSETDTAFTDEDMLPPHSADADADESEAEDEDIFDDDEI